jgi:CDP-diacylglycerol--glycerol-3-phosphate 3-phosphatidyltransferase
MALVWSTDYIDGFIARKFNLKTELGLCLDPLADKVVSIAVFITLYLFRGFPLWILIIVVIKDLTILIAGYYLLRRGSLATSDTAGRQTTVIVSAIILLYLFRLESLANILCYLLILLIITTLYNYAKRFFRELKQITLTTSQGNPR